MPRIADYLILSDNKISISATGEGGFSSDVNFTLEDTAHLPSRSILAFVVLAPDISGSIQLKAVVNGSTQLIYNLAAKMEGTFFSLHEVIDANVLRHGANTITFLPSAGKGTLELGDIVLHYQRDI